jgi:hypothetical protein
LLLFSFSAFGAVQYDFHQVSRSDSSSIPPTEFTARAFIDGESSRVEFLAGNAYPPGTYVISTNGSRTLTFVDPGLKSYTELSTSSVAASIGTSNITVENPRYDFAKLEDSPIIAGIPTDHYRLTISYDITVSFGTMPLKQQVRTIIDKWTTVQFGDIAESYLASGGIRTGNLELDAILDAETTRIKGFPLKQTIEIITTNMRGGAIPGSKLALSPTRTQKREITVTSIKQVPPKPAAFAVPVTYRRAEPGTNDLTKPGVQILSLEPASK